MNKPRPAQKGKKKRGIESVGEEKGKGQAWEGRAEGENESREGNARAMVGMK